MTLPKTTMPGLGRGWGSGGLGGGVARTALAYASARASRAGWFLEGDSEGSPTTRGWVLCSAALPCSAASTLAGAPLMPDRGMSPVAAWLAAGEGGCGSGVLKAPSSSLSSSVGPGLLTLGSAVAVCMVAGWLSAAAGAWRFSRCLAAFLAFANA